MCRRVNRKWLDLSESPSNAEEFLLQIGAEPEREQGDGREIREPSSDCFFLNFNGLAFQLEPRMGAEPLVKNVAEGVASAGQSSIAESGCAILDANARRRADTV